MLCLPQKKYSNNKWKTIHNNTFINVNLNFFYTRHRLANFFLKSQTVNIVTANGPRNKIKAITYLYNHLKCNHL